MKMKKALASVAAVAMAASMVSAFSVSTSALTEGTKIDFEDGDYSFVYLNLDDGSDNSVLSVEDYDGSKQLKVDVQQTGKVPKVWFDLDKITARENTVQISTIEMDLTFVPKSETEMVGWAGGVIASAGGFDQNNTQASQINPNWTQTDWASEDENAYTEGMPAKVHVTKKFLLPASKYTTEGTNPFFGIMRWAADTNYVMYVDNIVLKDKDGNALPVGVTAAATEEAATTEEAAAEETTAAVEETTAEVTEAATEAEVVEDTAAEEVVEDTAAEEVAAPAEEVTEAAAEEVTEAPAADTAATPVAATGNAAVASIAAVMAVAGAAALVSKRK